MILIKPINCRGSHSTLYNSLQQLSLLILLIIFVSSSQALLAQPSLITSTESSETVSSNSHFSSVMGEALAYDGNADIVEVPDHSSLDLTTEVSIEMWAKQAAVTGYAVMVMKASAGSWTNGYGLTISNGLDFHPIGWGTRINTNYTLPSNQWVHIAATYDGTDAKVYINGTLHTSQALSGSIPTNDHVMGIGGDYNTSSYSFQGEIDEVRVWNRALTETEINENMNCESPLNDNGLVANYNFNHGEAGEDNTNPAVTTLDDASGNNNHGLLKNFALTGTASNWVSPGGVSGTCAPRPEIDILGGMSPVSIENGDDTPDTVDGTDFGTQNVSSTTDHTFVIQNTGDEILNLTGTPIVELTNNPDGVFSIETQPTANSIGVGGSDLSFVVRFLPTVEGRYSATVSIASDDSNENPYTFDIEGITTGCDINIDEILKTNPTCGGSDGSFTVNASCNGCTLEYAFDGGSFDSNNTFSNLAEGAYSVTVRNTATPQCPVTVDVAMSAGCGFITTWEVTEQDLTITIPTTSSGYDYSVDWGDNGFSENQTGNATHTYDEPGIYTVQISGTFPQIYFYSSGQETKIQSIEQWGNINWRSFYYAFYNCSNLVYNATDVPDLTTAPEVTNLSYMFSGASSFNGDLSNWDVSTVINMSGMFQNASSFNQPLANWERTGSTLANVSTMSSMFSNATNFDQDISNWDVSSVTNMSSMFSYATSFDQDISDWNVTSVNSMSSMFTGASSFNQPLANWERTGSTLANVTNMYGLFYFASAFNQDISNWNTDMVTTMAYMLYQSSFDQDISSWNIESVTDMNFMLSYSAMSPTNYDNLLDGWATQTVQSNVSLGAHNLIYCASEDDRTTLTNAGWNITGDNKICFGAPFITTWEVTENDLSISIPIYTSGNSYYYTVDWGDGTDPTTHTSSATHTYTNPGEYTVQINGGFPQIYFYNSGHRTKIKSIDQWGDIPWKSFYYAFYNCTNLTYNATDVPDLSNVTSLSYMFSGASNFNGDISNWDVSTIMNMSGMFYQASSFNQPLANWERTESTLANVTNMYSMFYLADAFDQPIGNWNTSMVTTMQYMFYNTDFNQDISSWNIEAVTDMNFMLSYSAMSPTNYDNLLNGWAAQTVQSNVSLGAHNLSYCAGESARTTLTSAGWDITGDNRQCEEDAFITTWEVSSGELSLSIPIYGSGLAIDWGDGTYESNLSSFPSHTYNSADTYEIIIYGNAFQIYFAWRNGKDKIKTIEQWGTNAWTNMNYAFAGCSNLTLNATDIPDLTNITSLYYTFADATNFNGDLNSWDVSGVTSMFRTFQGASSFNGELSNWNVSNVTNMYGMFSGASAFNQDLSNWEDSPTSTVANVTDMRNMFKGASAFNQALDSWDISAVIYMQSMFQDASSFNQDLSNWETNGVLDMSYIFYNASSFDQSIGSWDITSLQSTYSLWLALMGTGISTDNYDDILMGWEAQNVLDNMVLSSDLQYCVGKEARDLLISDHNWRFIGDKRNKDLCPGLPFKTTWNITSSNEMIHIYTNQYSGYDFNIDWGDDTSDSDVTGTISHTYQNPGQYTVAITGFFPQFLASGPSWTDRDNARKIASIDQWGDIEWQSMYGAFAHAENMVSTLIAASDQPDLSKVYSTGYMFYNAKRFNSDLNDWDVSKVHYTYGMFSGATDFNGRLLKWDMSNVTYASSMFYGATSFNQDLSLWETDKIEGMYSMFYNATSFNQDLSDWDFSGLHPNYYTLWYTFSGSGLDVNNYDKLLMRLEDQAAMMPNAIRMDGTNLNYCSAANDRNTLINTYNWTINDAGLQGGCSFAPDEPPVIAFTQADATTFDFEIFPNPAKAQISLSLNIENFEYEHLIITDITGKVIYQQALTTDQPQLNIDLANKSIGTGVYQVSIRHSEGVMTKKLVVKR